MLCCWLNLNGQATVEPFYLKSNLQGGFYEEAVTVELYAPIGVKIFYTTNGAVPTPHSKPYQSPITIESTTVLRALAVKSLNEHSTWAATFFIDEPPTQLPVISLAIEPTLLFDADYGLFVAGRYVSDSIWSKPNANFWTRDEFPAHTEIFESDGTAVFNSETGFRLFGGFSRLFPQKSLTIVTRKKYGKKRIQHPVFGNSKPQKYKFLVLRNAGSDFGKTHFRDALMASLVENWDMDYQAYRPAHVYLNGIYWGIYNIREKINKHFLNAYHDIDKDSIDLLEHRSVVKKGSDEHYLNLLHYLASHDLSKKEHFDYVATQMEVNNFMDYQIAQIYFDNQDAGGNIKFWRPQTPNGRWRWILFDTDWGFGLNDYYAYNNNSLKFHTAPNGAEWPNPPWSTFILRKLLEYKDFQNLFVNRFADHLNRSFSTSFVQQRIDSFHHVLQLEIPRHLERWNLEETNWQRQVALLHTFAEKRPEIMRMHLMDFFKLGAQAILQLSTSEGGKVTLNQHIEVRHSFSGIYFEDIPIRVKAIADYGYRFSHWEEFPDKASELIISLRDTFRLKAVFEPYRHPLADKLMINEINPNARHAGDWIELYNYSDQAINLKNWKLSDIKHTFSLPPVEIGARDYLVVCQNASQFLETFPNAYNFVEGLTFGINKHHERLQLLAADGTAIDSVNYTIAPTDSTFTLSLLLPHLDNAQTENWTIRKGDGTPNAGNPYFIESSIKAEQNFWMQAGIMLGVGIIIILIFLAQIKIIM